MQENATYLGDGVYARFDGFQIWLYLDNGYGPHTEIALEPAVFNRLVEYQERLFKKQVEEPGEL